MNRNRILPSLIPVVLATAVAIAIAGYWLNASGSLGRLGGATYAVNMTVPTAGGLAPGTSVRMAGIRIGRVSGIKRVSSGAEVSMRIAKKYSPLPRDSAAELRLRTLVGENYISISRGRSAQDIPDGGVVPLAKNADYVEVDQILSVLRGKTRERARETLQGLGHGLSGEGHNLNDITDDASGFVQNASPVVDQLYRDRRQAARLIDNLGYVTDAVGERGAAIRSASVGATTTFRAIAASDDAVRSLLTELPGVMQQVRTTSGTLRAVGSTTGPRVARLATLVHDLGPTVAGLQPAAHVARTLVHELGRAAPPLTTTVKRLGTLAPPTTGAFPQVRSALCQLNPALDYLRPYATDIVTVLQDLGSTTNWYDATGHAARLFPTVATKDYAGLTPVQSKIVDQLLGSGVLGKLSGQTGYEPLPAPGRFDDLTQGVGVSGPSAVTKKYPRVQAAC